MKAADKTKHMSRPVFSCCVCNRLPSQSQRHWSVKGSDDWFFFLLLPIISRINVWSSLIFMACEKKVLCSLPRQVDAIQTVYKTDVVRAIYSQVSFAVQRTSLKSVYSVSARTLGLVSTWHRFTRTHLCTSVSLSCPPTEQLAPQCQPTPRPSQFPQIWHMMCCVLGNNWRRISSQPRSHSLNCISVEVIFTSFSDLHHYRLTSLQTDLRHYRLTSLLNHSVYWLPHVYIPSHPFQFCHSYHQ